MDGEFGDGYDPAFLASAVPLPQAVRERRLSELPYTHFTVLHDRDRRLAAATAVNIDGARLVDVPRADDWHLDTRIPAEEQAGPTLYRNNDLDRGHLVRRRDPVWGARDAAERANFDTFAYTNAAPQASGFNQSKLLWLGLEDHVLEHALAHSLRLTVFTGPVLADADPRYRGVQIPLAFWKVAAWSDAEGALAAAGFLLEQRAELDGVDLQEAFHRAERAESAPPLGPFRTFQVPIAEIEELTRLGLGPLARVDRLLLAGVAPKPGARRVRLNGPDDLIV
ncbi:MAG: DNA/RNA non-specific endonuclease [Salinibacterium sp.]|nr:DNA/RNA non-specific endonuclease [Salinibacterium sp.]MBF0671325.1 DNA/RNA non-specific endonuclease [Salinibacterium sp.]